jgi:hypothetical protein
MGPRPPPLPSHRPSGTRCTRAPASVAKDPTVSRALVVLLALVSLLVGCAGQQAEPAAEPAPRQTQDPEPAEPEEPESGPSAPLTGLPASDEVVQRPVLAVKIDNAPAARPQVGLDAADVVFEERVEGGAVRFIALYQSQLPDRVGPVRSARPIDVAVLGSFGHPVLAYSGARPEVAAMLAGAPIALVTEGAPGVGRESSRRAPHNLFVAPGDVLEVGIERGATPLGDHAVWEFGAAPSGQPAGCDDHETATDADGETGADTGTDTDGDGAADCDAAGHALSVAMTPTVETAFAFDEADSVYHRRENGEAPDAGDPGWDNVLVLATRHYRGGCCDTAGQPYDETELRGGDRLVLLRDGERLTGRWDKPDDGAPLRLLDDDGDPLPLAEGRTWVLLPPAEAVDAL